MAGATIQARRWKQSSGPGEDHNVAACSYRTYFRVDEFREHLRHHHDVIGEWANIIPTLCMIDDDPKGQLPTPESVCQEQKFVSSGRSYTEFLDGPHMGRQLPTCTSLKTAISASTSPMLDSMSEELMVYRESVLFVLRI